MNQMFRKGPYIRGAIRSARCRKIGHLTGRLGISTLENSVDYSLEEDASGVHRIKWAKRPRNVYILAKPNWEPALGAVAEFASWTKANVGLNVIVDRKLHNEIPSLKDVCIVEDEDSAYLSNKVDLICTIGGDGTFIRAAAKFVRRMPPMLTFFMGSVGFLTQFEFSEYKDIMHKVVGGGVYLVQKLRLGYRVLDKNVISSNSLNTRHDFRPILNEVFIRSRTPHTLTRINCGIKSANGANDVKLGDFDTEGVIIATQTGSTGHSLSAGGPLIHPRADVITLTQVCSRSLASRPIVLPPDVHLELKASEPGDCKLSIVVDGGVPYEVNKHSLVEIAPSSYPVPFIVKDNYFELWSDKIRKTLGWNHFVRN